MPHKIFQESFLHYKKEKYEEIISIKKEFDLKGATLLPHLNLLPFAACITNEKGKFLDVNKKYTKLSGYKKEELIGQHITKVVMDLTKKEVDVLYQQFWLEGEDIRKKYFLKTKNGDVLNVIANASKVTENNQLKKVTFIADITSWDRAQLEILKRAEEINDNLEIQRRALEVAIHDIKNYVSNIILSSEMLSDEIKDASHQSYINLIKKNSSAIGNHIAELSRIIRIENGDYEANIREFNILDTIKEIISEFSEAIRIKKLKVEIENKLSKSLNLKSDAFCLKCSLRNLIKNAIEASPKSKTITLELSTDTELHIDIHNFGTIPLEIQDRFFHKYVTSTKNNSNRGSGLGTYIAKKMLDQISGRISFTSCPENGTTIFLTLPLTNSSPETKEEMAD